MTIFDHPIFWHVLPYFHVGEGREAGGRDNVDLLELPDQLRALAVDVIVNCIACGAVISPFRARVKSEKCRVAGSAVERRLFYSGVCASDRSCSRTRACQQHKDELLGLVLGRRRHAEARRMG